MFVTTHFEHLHRCSFDSHASFGTHTYMLYRFNINKEHFLAWFEFPVFFSFGAFLILSQMASTYWKNLNTATQRMYVHTLSRETCALVAWCSGHSECFEQNIVGSIYKFLRMFCLQERDANATSQRIWGAFETKLNC
jgi:hypothetical protein